MFVKKNLIFVLRARSADLSCLRWRCEDETKRKSYPALFRKLNKLPCVLHTYIYILENEVINQQLDIHLIATAGCELFRTVRLQKGHLHKKLCSATKSILAALTSELDDMNYMSHADNQIQIETWLLIAFKVSITIHLFLYEAWCTTMQHIKHLIINITIVSVLELSALLKHVSH